jgi:hypothetical protein
MSDSKTVTPEMVKNAGVLLKREHEARVKIEGDLSKLAAETAKRERAEKIAFREVEMGLSEPFKNHEEFQSKVASLMQDDLDVIEKALARGYHGKAAGGSLEGETGDKLDPFSRWVLHGELNSN